MKTNFLLPLALLTFILSGCGATSIADLSLPPVSTIEGTVTELNQDGFTLADRSGSILVRAIPSEDSKLDIAQNEKVKIYGNLLGGTVGIFDAYVIRKSTGEQIIVSDPEPHFGFVVQSSFR